ncbi:MAG: ABC transporter permease, partial [Gemmatimonadales bacterium]
MTRRPFTEFLYRLLLVAYPSDFRRMLGGEAAGAFGQLHRDEWREGGIKAVAGLWRRSVLQVIVYGLKERWEKRQRSSRTNAGRPPTRQRDPLVYSLVSDIRHAIRSLTRTPIFSVTAIAIVALGIGATTTIYSVVDNVLLRPLPYPNPHQLVTFTKGLGSFPVPDFVDVRDRTSAFASIAAMTNVTFDLTGDGAPEQLASARATEEFLPIFGATAAIGRLLTPEDFGPGAPNVAVLSYGLWQRRWGRDPNIVGKPVTLSAEPFVVVGVLGREFESPEALQWGDIELWVPLDVTTPEWQNRRIFILATIGRLAPGVTLAAAQAEFDALARILADEYPRGNRQADGSPYYFPLVPLHQATVGAVTQTLYVLLGAVGLLLLIACANVANLFLARGTDREREMALRAALGASRTRVIRQLLAESVVLALAGGAVGTGLSFVGIRAFGLFNPGGIPRLSEVVVDWRVLAFAVTLSMLTGMLFGMVPAFQSAKTDVTNALKDGAQGVTAGRHRARLRNSLVVAEIGLALVLLVGAGLLFNSFLNLQQVDPGFDSDNTTILSLRLGTFGGPVTGRYGTSESRLELADDLLERIRTMPGVEAAGAAVRMPFGGGRCCWGDDVVPDGGSGDSVAAWIHPVTHGMMEALG